MLKNSPFRNKRIFSHFYRKDAKKGLDKFGGGDNLGVYLGAPLQTERSESAREGTQGDFFMKKIAMIVISACILASGAFALDMGVGGIFEYNYVPGFTKVGNNSGSTEMHALGFKAFFDAQYAAVSFGVDGTVGKVKIKNKTTGVTTELNQQATFLNLGIMGKYPFSVGNAKIYPIVGFDFDFAIAAKADGKKMELTAEQKKGMNRYWFDIGLGADIPVALDGKLCIRPQALFGVQMNMTDDVKTAKKFAESLGLKYSNVVLKTQVGVGVIYKF